MNADQLTHTFIARGDFEQLRGSHDLLYKIAAYLDGDSDVFRWLLKYADHFSRYPSFAELEEWVTTSPTLVNGKDIWDPPTVGMHIKQVAALTVWPVHQGSWAQIIEDFVHYARRNYYVVKFKEAQHIIIGGLAIDKHTTLTGVDAALQYIDSARKNDFTIPVQVAKRTETTSIPTIDELCNQILAKAEPTLTIEELSAAIGATV